MLKDEALGIIKEVCAAIQTDLKTHTRIQEAIKFIEAELSKLDK